MVQLSTLLFALTAAASVTAAPTLLSKRIAQVITDSTTKWEAACVSKNRFRSEGKVLTNCLRLLGYRGRRPAMQSHRRQRFWYASRRRRSLRSAKQCRHDDGPLQETELP